MSEKANVRYPVKYVLLIILRLTVYIYQYRVDTYNSHEGLIYCKPHFKQLFQPKAVLDSDEPCNKTSTILFRKIVLN